jgi:acid phosphatase
MKFCLLILVSAATAFAQVPHSNHVWVITEENHSQEEVMGNPSMPYFNWLAQSYASATQYYGPRHNSLSALMWLVAAQTVTTDNNTTTCFSTNNIVRQLLQRGATWRSYQTDLPYAGFTGLWYGNYVRRHNPLIDFAEACTPPQSLNSVPFTQLAQDIANHATPNYAYITPNLDEDAHDGSLAQADQWLAQQVPAILALPEFQPGGDGILLIVWDEGDLANDNRCSARLNSGCGGRLATLVIGPQVKPRFQSPVLYSHSNLLRTVCDAMQLSSCPGEAALASPMDDFFNTVNITSPFDQSAVASPVLVQASARNSSPVFAMQVYVDDVLAYLAFSSTLTASIPMPPGKHTLTVQSWDTEGGIHKSAIMLDVQPTAVVLRSPAPNAVVPPSVFISADASGAAPVRSITVSVDGAVATVVNGSSVNTSLALSAGAHVLQIQSTDSAGNVGTNQFSVTVANPSINLLSPAAGSWLYSPIQLWASTQDPRPVYAMQVYVDDVLVHEFTGQGINTSFSLPSPGVHKLTFQAWDTAGGVYKSDVNINILPVNVSIGSPVQGSVLASPVHMSAWVSPDTPVYAMQIYVDDALAYQTNGRVVDTYLPLASGAHHIVAKAWDEGGGTWTSGVNLTVR